MRVCRQPFGYQHGLRGRKGGVITSGHNLIEILSLGQPVLCRRQFAAGLLQQSANHFLGCLIQASPIAEHIAQERRGDSRKVALAIDLQGNQAVGFEQDFHRSVIQGIDHAALLLRQHNKDVIVGIRFIVAARARTKQDESLDLTADRLNLA
jgi:hypothetical protein